MHNCFLLQSEPDALCTCFVPQANTSCLLSLERACGITAQQISPNIGLGI